MPPERKPAFLDSNVLIYLFDAADPRKQELAIETLAALGPENIVISAQVLSEFYVNVTRLAAAPLSTEEARLAVGRFSKLRVVPITADRVDEAMDIQARWQTSYWDGLIIAAAAAAGCLRVLTEDLQHGQTIAGVEIVNPFAEV